MKYRMLTPVQVWEGYDPQQEDLETQQKKKLISKDYTFYTYGLVALRVTDGDVQVGVEVVENNQQKLNKAVLIVQEYHQPVQREVIKSLANKGYTVIIPDCTGIGKGGGKTKFPPSLNYGNIDEAGDHIKKVCPTAMDTSQYLYTMIIKRVITFINRDLEIKDIAAIGIGEATEVAMQTAGSDKRLKGLVCINGAGYKEYLHINKYGHKKDLELDEQTLSWLTGVAAVAYAKHTDIPVMIAISSNSKSADIDRLPNIVGLLPNKETCISITPGSHNSIGQYSYNAILAWLDDVLNDQPTLKRPKVTLNVSEESIYAEVEADRNKEIEEVFVYYSYGDFDHLVRNWQKVECQTISRTQFIAKLEITQKKGPLFVFCDIIYKKGFNLSSMATYSELEDLNFLPTAPLGSTRIVYEGAMGIATFTEESKKQVLLRSSIRMQKIPIGLTGVMSDYGELLSFDIGRFGKQNKERILQIDAYSPKDIIFEVTLITKKDDIVQEYSASSSLAGKGQAFTSLKFFANECKNERMLPLEDWSYVKAIKFSNIGVIIGKILFI